MRVIRRVLACQMRGSLTRREEDTPKLLSPLRREKKVRRTAVVYVCLCFWATADTTTLSNLKDFLGELAIPASGLVYVYLDVEPHVRWTPAYGSGWANAIRTGTDSSRAESFRPALYCQYVQDSSTGLWGPNSLVAQALNDACRLAWLCCRMLWSLARTARGRSSLLCSDGRTRLESILAVFPKSLRHRNIRARPSLSVY